jgi:hypothetical protein
MLLSPIGELAHHTGHRGERSDDATTDQGGQAGAETNATTAVVRLSLKFWEREAEAPSSAYCMARTCGRIWSLNNASLSSLALEKAVKLAS